MNYKSEYEDLIKLIDSGNPVPAETVGKLIIKMAYYFSEAIGNVVRAEFSYNKKLAEFEQKIDDNGKPLSSSKAEAQAKATAEYLAYISAKGEVSSIEAMINACKSLQKSLQNDYSYSGI